MQKKKKKIINKKHKVSALRAFASEILKLQICYLATQT